MSNHISAKKGDIAESILLPGDPLRAKYIAENFIDSPVQFNNIRNILGYTGRYKGVPVSVMGTGMGMPSMGIYSWELMKEYNVENLIRIGTAGSIQHDIKIKEVVLGLSASTDSNYIHTFNLKGNFAPTANIDLIIKAMEAASNLKIKVHVGNIHSGDVFYEIGDTWWENWAKMGTLAVEMESAALYINAAYMRKKALCICTISNHLITGEETTPEERETTFNDMVRIALETATV